MTSRWRKKLGKICDLIFCVPIAADCWPASHFEPLIVGLAFPLSRHQPWKLRGTPLVDRVERELRDLPPASPSWGRDLLRQLLLTTRDMESMPTGLVRELLQGE